MKTMMVLNRIVEWTSTGINYEADQRHADIICSELGLKEGSRGVTTPGAKHKPEPEEDDELNSDNATAFRALAARANYLAPDRPGTQYATKELPRHE